MRITNRVVALLFAASALVQINDPDPAGWVLLYLAAMIACLLWAKSRGWIVSAVVAVVAVVWAISIWRVIPRLVSITEMFEPMESKGGAVELGREFWGLCIIAVWMSFLVWKAQKRNTK